MNVHTGIVCLCVCYFFLCVAGIMHLGEGNCFKLRNDAYNGVVGWKPKFIAFSFSVSVCGFLLEFRPIKVNWGFKPFFMFRSYVCFKFRPLNCHTRKKYVKTKFPLYKWVCYEHAYWSLILGGVIWPISMFIATSFL